jgi:copper chaperone CopZ
MENNDNKTHKWNNMFIKYCEYEKKCVENINAIEKIKINFTKLLGNQKKDDLIFYKSLIENSYFYLSNSLKIRKKKILNDLNYIWSCIDDKKQMDEVNENNFTALIKDYEKMVTNINLSKKNNTALSWVKNDNIESFHDLEKNIYEILEYHLKLIEYFCLSVELEKGFYCEK